MLSQVKYLEIRDRSTFIPVVAYKFETMSDSGYETYAHECARFLVARAGYSTSAYTQRHDYTIVTKLVGLETKYDGNSWGNNRTMTVAHRYIHANFETIFDGDIIDVEYILGETDSPKLSERIENDSY